MLIEKDKYCNMSYDFSNVFKEIEQTQKRINSLMLPVLDTIAKLCEFIQPILPVLQELSEKFKPMHAIKIMAENQFVFWDYMNMDFVEEIINAKNPNATLRKYFIIDDKNYIMNTIERTINSSYLGENTKLYKQSIDAYWHKNYQLSITGLLAVSDQLLSDFSGNNSTSIFKRAQVIIEKAECNIDIDDDEVSILALVMTFTDTVESLSTNMFPFDGKHPDKLNRHWIMHGRWKRNISQLDCVKIINFIYVIIAMHEYGEKELV